LIFLMIFRDFCEQRHSTPVSMYLLTPTLSACGCNSSNHFMVRHLYGTVVLPQCQRHNRLFSNRVLLSPPSHSTPADSSVEWSYALDVHINAFFPLYLTLYLAQLFLLPIILKDNWVCLWVGNTLYLAAYVPLFAPSAAYTDISVRQLCTICVRRLSGFEWLVTACVSIPLAEIYVPTALPFLIRSELLLAPLLPLFMSYVLSLLGFNVAKHVLHAYFGS
jgi:hypothetical protein